MIIFIFFYSKIMLKLNQNIPLENQLVRLTSNLYQVPAIYTGIEGKYDLSNYDNITIIIPEIVQYFGSFCLTCFSSSPTKLTNNSNNHKIIFNHNSFNNVEFLPFCFDGIKIFEFNDDNVLNSLPDYVSSYPYSKIRYEDSKLIKISKIPNIDSFKSLKETLSDKIKTISAEIDNIKIIMNYPLDTNLSIKAMKYNLIKYDKINDKLRDIGYILI